MTRVVHLRKVAIMSVIAALSDGTTRIVPIDGVDSVSALVGTLREALALPHPAEAYDVYVGAEGEEEVVAERACDLAEAGVVGCEERVTLRVRGEYVAREELRAEGVETAEGAVTALLSAMDAGDVERVRRVAAAGWTGVGRFVQWAVREGNREVVEALLLGAPRGGMDENALLRMLCGLELASSDASGGPCCLSVAVGLLLDMGADVNTADVDGVTALATACLRGHVRLVETLLERGANIDSQDDIRSTPLHEACGWGKERVVTVLLAHGADVHARSADRRTPLFAACDSYMWSRALIKALLAKGAEANAWDEDGNTPLHVVASDGVVGLAGVLIEAGADVNAVNAQGITPVRVARRRFNGSMVRYLVAHGAEPDPGDDALSSSSEEEDPCCPLTSRD